MLLLSDYKAKSSSLQNDRMTMNGIRVLVHYTNTQVQNHYYVILGGFVETIAWSTMDPEDVEVRNIV